MKTSLHLDTSGYVRVGAAGAMGAVTLLWIGGLSEVCFQLGTVLLVLCLVPMARGLGARGGAILGLLLGLVWVAARLGLAKTLRVDLVFTEVNIMVLAAMVTIGGLAGARLAADVAGRPGQRPAPRNLAEPAGVLRQPAADSTANRASPPMRVLLEEVWGEALARHREWLTTWDQASTPWTSFDAHIREIARSLTGLRHLRCYRVGGDGRLYPLSQDVHREGVLPSSHPLLSRVVMTGQPFLQGSATTGPLIEQLAAGAGSPVVWALPIQDRSTTVGLITAGGMGEPPAAEARVLRAADLLGQMWLHVHHLDLLRVARQTDRGSGLIDRTNFLPAFKDTLAECYRLHEPVVVMVVCLEGLRGLDDNSQWARRDELVERVGQTIARGIRRDDIVGRFSDSQFVALLRRLDTPLAELICRKLMSSMARVISDFDLAAWVTPRAGLCGTGFTQLTPEDLLKHAISALTQARAQDILLVSEAPTPKTPAGAGR